MWMAICLNRKLEIHSKSSSRCRGAPVIEAMQILLSLTSFHSIMSIRKKANDRVRNDKCRPEKGPHTGTVCPLAFDCKTPR